MSELQKLVEELCCNGIEYRELQAVLSIKNGSDYKKFGKGKYPVYGSGGVMTYIDRYMFQNYYKDVSLRMKNRELDILIVVNMFLTGFDATTLNTLWVDKNLKMHGLIQAFSRTNRILNSI